MLKLRKQLIYELGNFHGTLAAKIRQGALQVQSPSSRNDYLLCRNRSTAQFFATDLFANCQCGPSVKGSRGVFQGMRLARGGTSDDSASRSPRRGKLPSTSINIASAGQGDAIPDQLHESTLKQQRVPHYHGTCAKCKFQSHKKMVRCTCVKELPSPFPDAKKKAKSS